MTTKQTQKGTSVFIRTRLLFNLGIFKTLGTEIAYITVIKLYNMIIYKATNKINGKIYIGQTTRSLKKRKTEHNTIPKNPKTYFQKALIKYGKRNFIWEIIDTCDTIKKLNKLETWYIAYYGSHNNNTGYNLTGGGEGNCGFTMSEKTKRKMSKAKLNATPEEKTKRNKKFIKTINNKSPEEKIEKIKRFIKTMANRTAEEKAGDKRKKLKTIANKTPKEKAEKIRKFIKTMSNKTTEEKDKRKKALSNANNKKIIINNITYKSAKIAAEILKISYGKICRRARLDKFPKYQYV